MQRVFQLTEIVPAPSSTDTTLPASLKLCALPAFSAGIQLTGTQVTNLKLLEVLTEVRESHPEKEKNSHIRYVHVR